MIQLCFVLQVFWKWYVLSYAARGGLFSFPTCVGCCFYSWAIENEWFLWLVEGFSHAHSWYWPPKTKRTAQLLSDRSDSTKEKDGHFWLLLLTCHWGPQGIRLAKALGFISCHVEAPRTVHTVFPYMTLGPNLLSRKSLSFREKAAASVPFRLPSPTLGSDEEAPPFRAVITSAAFCRMPLRACWPWALCLILPISPNTRYNYPHSSDKEKPSLLEVSKLTPRQVAGTFHSWNLKPVIDTRASRLTSVFSHEWHMPLGK